MSGVHSVPTLSACSRPPVSPLGIAPPPQSSLPRAAPPPPPLLMPSSASLLHREPQLPRGRWAAHHRNRWEDLRHRRERAYAVTARVAIRAIALSTRQRPTAAAKRACCSGCGVGASGAFSSGCSGTSSRTQPRTHRPRRTASRTVTAVAAAVACPRATAYAAHAIPSVSVTGAGAASASSCPPTGRLRLLWPCRRLHRLSRRRLLRHPRRARRMPSHRRLCRPHRCHHLRGRGAGTATAGRRCPGPPRT
jgi:hypothetical protein